MANEDGVRIFYAYASADEALRNQLDKHLSALRQQKQIVVWHDYQVLPGAERETEIEEHLKSANIILLLISPDFLASDFCHGKGMKLALERHKAGEARVVPVILRPVDWQGTPFAHLQALPKNARPVVKWSLRDDALLDIAKGIRTIVEEVYTASYTSKMSSEILEFAKKYRRQVGERHGYIVPPNFDTSRKVPIDTLYVSPTFVSPNERKQPQEVEGLDLAKFIAGISRTVLLGQPGGGKSTLSLKLCRDLAMRSSEPPVASRTEPMPILVVLRDYGAQKKAQNCSIREFIEAKAKSDYQLTPPPGAFEALLSQARALVLFDGLDELLDTRYRQEISNDVESFCNLYPLAPVLVTSREVGYDQAPLNEQVFKVFRLAPFDNDQVQEYVTKWFDVDTDLTAEEKARKVEMFLEESSIVPDLRSNALMLALICNIYRGENFIPKNRPEVYEKCSTMLFERWDKSRGIYVTLPVDWHVSPMMKYLAHWIYTSESLRQGVEESKLIAKATEYLCERRFEDPYEAEQAARQFIDFCCKGRAWVFTDTGTTKTGEKLYQFTHQTFLEFFTAAYLERTCETTDKLLAVLQPRIANKEWDNVAQLAFQIRSKSSEDAADRLLSALAEQAKGADQRCHNILSFAARCLEFIVPSPKVARNITKAGIDYAMAWGLERSGMDLDEGASKRFVSSYPSEIIGALLCAAIENRVPVADTVEKQLTERVVSGNEAEALLALEIGLDLRVYISNKTGRGEIVSFWVDVSKRIENSCSDFITAFLPKSVRLCRQLFLRQGLLIADLVKWHGFEGLFFEYSHTIRPNLYFLPLISSLLEFVLIEKIGQSRLAKPLKDIGYLISLYPTPWIKRKWSRNKLFLFLPTIGIDSNLIHHSKRNEKIEKDTMFGAFVLLAAFFEWKESVDRRTELEVNGYPLPESLHWMLLARFEPQYVDKARDEISKCGFSIEQEKYVWKWIRREMNFVEEGEEQIDGQTKRKKL